MKGKGWALSILPFVVTGLCAGRLQKGESHLYEWNAAVQGTTARILYYKEGAPLDTNLFRKQFQLLDRLFSRYQPGTRILAFNESQRGIAIEPAFHQLMQQSLAIYHETGGLFDPTVMPLIRFWQQQGDGRKYRKRALRRLQSCVGADKLVLKEDSLLKSAPCVQLDLDGIAQGFSVDQLAAFLEALGIENFLVEVGGELRVKGRKLPGGEPFRIALEQPGGDDWSVQSNSLVISLPDGALTTSGTYRKHLGRGANPRNHIIDPFTGRPVDNEIVSVTVFAANATLADGYDNALLAMGLEKALAFTEAHPEIAARFIYRLPDNRLRDTASVRFITLLKPDTQ